MSLKNTGTYARLIPSKDTRNKIAAIMELFNIENHISPHDLHVTLIYSRQECPLLKEELVGLPVIVKGKAFNIYSTVDGGKCLVVELESEELQKIHSRLRTEHNATHDFASYNPHLTLSYDFTSGVIPSETMLEHFFHLTFDQLVVEKLNFEWTAHEYQN